LHPSRIHTLNMSMSRYPEMTRYHHDEIPKSRDAEMVDSSNWSILSTSGQKGSKGSKRVQKGVPLFRPLLPRETPGTKGTTYDEGTVVVCTLPGSLKTPILGGSWNPSKMVHFRGPKPYHPLRSCCCCMVPNTPIMPIEVSWMWWLPCVCPEASKKGPKRVQKGSILGSILGVSGSPTSYSEIRGIATRIFGMHPTPDFMPPEGSPVYPPSRGLEPSRCYSGIRGVARSIYPYVPIPILPKSLISRVPKSRDPEIPRSRGPEILRSRDPEGPDPELSRSLRSLRSPLLLEAHTTCYG